MSRVIQTDRLILRRWNSRDHAPFAKMNADPRVMEFMLKPLSSQESDSFIDRIEAHFTQYGYGLYAAEEISSQCLAGFIGLSVPRFEAHFTPCVEIGWRLGFEHWGKGYATEAAKAVLRVARDEFKLKDLVSFTATINTRSMKVMERIGMQRNPDEDFDHPMVPDGNPLKRHVLYRIKL